MFLLVVSKEIILFSVKFIIIEGNFFKNEILTKYHRKFKKFEIYPSFQKG